MPLRHRQVGGLNCHHESGRSPVPEGEIEGLHRSGSQYLKDAARDKRPIKMMVDDAEESQLKNSIDGIRLAAACARSDRLPRCSL